MTQLWWFEKLGAAVIWTFWNGTISFFLDSAWLSSPWTQDVWWTWRLGAHILDCFLNVYNTIECILLRIVHRHLWFPKKHIHDDDMTPCWNMLKLCQYLGSLSKKTQRRTRCFCKPCSARLTHLGKRQPRSKSKPETLGLHDGYMMVTWWLHGCFPLSHSGELQLVSETFWNWLWIKSPNTSQWAVSSTQSSLANYTSNII